jgi:PAP2 superfamily
MAPRDSVRQLGRGWSDHVPERLRSALAEVLLLGFVLLAFTRLHTAAGTAVAAATTNAQALQSVERWSHLDVELATNHWLAEHEMFITPAVLVYRLYYAVLLGVLLWVFIRHVDIYLRVRRSFVAMVGLALLAFWVAPVSPPRFALAGVVDIVAEHDVLASQLSRDAGSGANHFSAMPSLHVGWSAWCAYAVWLALRVAHPRAAILAWILPLVMSVVVLATGNHYVLDVVGSGMLLVASIATASGWGRLVDRRTRLSRNR